MGGGELEALRIIGEDAVVFGDGLIVIFLRVGDFAEIELRIGGEVGVSIMFEVVLEFLTGEIVFAAGDVAEAVGVEGIGGRRGTASRRRTACGESSSAGRGSRTKPGTCNASGRRCATTAGDFGIKTLHGVLQIDQLLIEFAKARFNFLE